jgi:hypothetical protein
MQASKPLWSEHTQSHLLGPLLDHVQHVVSISKTLETGKIPWLRFL